MPGRKPRDMAIALPDLDRMRMIHVADAIDRLVVVRAMDDPLLMERALRVQQLHPVWCHQLEPRIRAAKLAWRARRLR